MKRVTGLGGVFFKSDDNKKLYQWYKKHLDINFTDWGGHFKWRDLNEDKVCYTAWSIFKEDTKYLDPSTKGMMINYRVDNLEALMKILEEEGVQIVGDMEVSEYGKFGWVMDPDGNKIELWEPPVNESDHVE